MAETPLFFLIAGEASGDLLGAHLMRALKKITNGQVRFAGIGGERMQAEGIDLFFQQSELAHVGSFELLRHVPHLLRRMKQTVVEVRRRRPAALITIDAPDFCFRVAKKLKGEGIPLIHYVAPTVWVWRPGRARKIARFLDHLLTLLPFEPPYFTREGLGCTFVGHPIVESAAAKGDAQRFRAKYAVKPEAQLLAVLPGSRMSEVSRLMPIFGETVKYLQARHPQLQIVIPTLSNLVTYVKNHTKGWSVPVLVTQGDKDKYDVFAAAQASLACSGTVAVELAMARLPAAIAYKINNVTAFIYRRLIKGKYANLVNIMHDRAVVPEFLQENCTPGKLASAIDELLSDKQVRQQQVAGLADVASWLGQGQFVPSERAAQTVLSVVSQRHIPTILQVLPRLVTGGVERGTVEMSAAIVATGWKAIVVSAGGPMVQEIERAGGVHIELPLHSKNPGIMYRNINRLADIIRRYNIDIIHARSRAPAWSAWAAARCTGRPFMTTFHNAYGASSWLKRRYNSVMAKGERVIAISNFVARHAARTYGIEQTCLRTIPRGVDINKFNFDHIGSERTEKLSREWRLPEGKPVIMLPGRLTRWKGQLVLIEAMARLGRRDVVCVVVGRGTAGYRQEIEQAVARHNLGEVVRLVDDCRDMPAAYKLANVVVVPSTRPEGFGRVIIEAQAMGCAVIATEHGGACETVVPGETGWLVPPNDSATLMKVLTKVLALTAEERTVLAQRAIAHIHAHFTTDMMTSKTLAVYRELLKEKPI